MLLLDHVEPTKWYVVSDVAKILGWSEDYIYDRIDEGELQAQIGERRSGRRKRKYTCYKVQGCEIIRYAREHMTLLKSERRVA